MANSSLSSSIRAYSQETIRNAIFERPQGLMGAVGGRGVTMGVWHSAHVPPTCTATICADERLCMCKVPHRRQLMTMVDGVVLQERIGMCDLEGRQGFMSVRGVA